MNLLDYFTELGIAGIICFYIIILILLIISPIIVSVYIVNFFGLTGINWWAFAIVIYLIIAGIIHKLFSSE